MLEECSFEETVDIDAVPPLTRILEFSKNEFFALTFSAQTVLPQDHRTSHLKRCVKDETMVSSTTILCSSALTTVAQSSRPPPNRRAPLRSSVQRLSSRIGEMTGYFDESPGRQYLREQPGPQPTAPPSAPQASTCRALPLIDRASRRLLLLQASLLPSGSSTPWGSLATQGSASRRRSATVRQRSLTAAW